MQTWINYHLEMTDIPLPLCSQLLYMITKHLVPRIVLCTTMENVVQEINDTPMAVLRPSAFQDLESRLSAVRQILNGNLSLPQDDPDMETLSRD